MTTSNNIKDHLLQCQCSFSVWITTAGPHHPSPTLTTVDWLTRRGRIISTWFFRTTLQ